MKFIRSPLYDGFFIWSGIPAGLLLVAAPWLMLPLMVMLDVAHLLSPIVLAWSHPGFRRIMVRRGIKFIVIPAAIWIGAIAAGFAVGRSFYINPMTLGFRTTSLADLKKPLVDLVILFVVWNAYHFGSQNFGILSIYQRLNGIRRHRRWLNKWGAIAVTVAVMAHVQFLKLLAFGLIGADFLLHLSDRVMAVAMPWLVQPRPILGLFVLGLISVNHWLTAIGLSSHVWSRHTGHWPLWFTLGLILCGTGLFFGFLDFGPRLAQNLGVHVDGRVIKVPMIGTVVVTMTAIGFRVGLGFVHFLYDRWIWKFSDPAVRTTIVQDLFRPLGGVEPALAGAAAKTAA